MSGWGSDWILSTPVLTALWLPGKASTSLIYVHIKLLVIAGHWLMNSRPFGWCLDVVLQPLCSDRTTEGMLIWCLKALLIQAWCLAKCLAGAYLRMNFILEWNSSLDGSRHWQKCNRILFELILSVNFIFCYNIDSCCEVAPMMMVPFYPPDCLYLCCEKEVQ